MRSRAGRDGGAVIQDIPRRVGRGRTVFLSVVAIDSVGTGLFLPVSVMYFTTVVGMAPAQVGMALTVAGLLGIAGGPFAGYLIDRLGPGWTVGVASLARAAAFTSYLYVDTLPQFIAAATVAQVAAQWSKPAMMSLAEQVGGERHRVTLLAWTRSIRNVGIGVASAGAAIILARYGQSWFAPLIAADAVAVATVGVLCGAFLRGRSGVASGGTAPLPDRGRASGFREVVRDRAYLGLVFACALLAWQTPLLTVGLPLWLRQADDAEHLVAVALTANTVAVALLQVRFSKGADAPGRAVTMLRRGAAWLAASCLCLVPLHLVDSTAAAVMSLVVAFALANTMAELLFSPGGWALAFDLAPKGRNSSHLTVFSMGESLGQATAPLVLGLLISGVSAWAWVALGAVFVLLFTVLRALRPVAAARATSHPDTQDPPVGDRAGLGAPRTDASSSSEGRD